MFVIDEPVIHRSALLCRCTPDLATSLSFCQCVNILKSPVFFLWKKNQCPLLPIQELVTATLCNDTTSMNGSHYGQGLSRRVGGIAIKFVRVTNSECGIVYYG